MKTFGELFKKYRLRAEFASLSALADALAEKGYIFDLSILSQWQKGKRIPTRRAVLIVVIALFIERDGISTLEQSNEFMESAGHGYLTEREQNLLFSSNSIFTPQTL